MFSRIARTLTNVAELTDNTGLADALRRDAMQASAATITRLLIHGVAEEHDAMVLASRAIYGYGCAGPGACGQIAA